MSGHNRLLGGTTGGLLQFVICLHRTLDLRAASQRQDCEFWPPSPKRRGPLAFGGAGRAK